MSSELKTQLRNLLKEGKGVSEIKDLLLAYKGNVSTILYYFESLGTVDYNGNDTGIALNFNDDETVLEICNLLTKDELDVLLICTHLSEMHNVERLDKYMSNKKVSSDIYNKIKHLYES